MKTVNEIVKKEWDNQFLNTISRLENWNPNKYKATKYKGEIQVVDFFSGCGGVSLGFAAIDSENPKFNILAGLDINEDATKTYSENFGVESFNQDIRDLLEDDNLTELLNNIKYYDPSKKTVLIGCAPCQGFTAHRKKNWSEEDERNNLVTIFAKIATKIQPDCIVMENVPDLLSLKYWRYFDHARSILEDSGYIVKQGIYNSAAFGVAQERFRSIVVAMKKNFILPLPVLVDDDFKTVRDVIGDLPKVDAGEQHSADTYHKSAKHKSSTLDIIKSVPQNGGNRPKGIGPNCLDKVKGYSDVYGRLSWDKPSITITHYSRNPASGRFIHPEQNRGLTMREAARLQSFPDGFIFEGGFDSVFKQIGEAVPPRLSLAIANAVYNSLKDDCILNTELLNEEKKIIVTSPVSNSYVSQQKKRGRVNAIS